MKRGEKVVINFAGISGSGKSAACQDTAVALGALRYTPSKTIRAFASTNGLRLAEPADYRRCLAVMNERDQDALIRPILETPARVICVDSLRRPRDILRLRFDFGIPVYTIFLWASQRHCYERILRDPERTGGQRPLPLTPEAFTREVEAEWRSTDPMQPAVGSVIGAGNAYEVIDVDPLPMDDPSPTKADIIERAVKIGHAFVAQARISPSQQM